MLKKLSDADLISSKTYPMSGQKPFRLFSLTKLGLDELKLQTGLELEKVQFKSNYPLHDARLSSVRNLFSRIEGCDVFISETVIQSKFLEADVSDLTLFRAHRVDAVARIRISNKMVWAPIELERGHKGIARYTERIKKIYQTDSMKAVLFVTESVTLRNSLVEIEKTIYPGQKRRLLFCDLPTLLNAESSVTFSTSLGETLQFILGTNMNTSYPLLDQTFTYQLK
ncbi:MAG: hypothetical protein K2X47_06800 [Bdellovibrionales bacterium]|nr:hypothetical protein [Bdellovibrionales bacterium]